MDQVIVMVMVVVTGTATEMVIQADRLIQGSGSGQLYQQPQVQRSVKYIESGK